MKSFHKVSSFIGFLSLALVSNYSFAGWEFKSVESFDRMEGRTYVVSHCEDKIGDDCTTPGSATRYDITILAEFLASAPIIR